MKSHKPAIAFLILIFIFSFYSTIFADTQDYSDEDIVRVGFFDFSGYHDISPTGVRSGYGYEYLQELAKYTNFKYEYVYEDFETCLELLKQGKIDLLTSVSYTEERASYLEFSKHAMGIKSTILTTSALNDEFIPGNLDSLNGMRVGMLSANVHTHNKDFEEYAQEHGLSYIAVAGYKEEKHLTEALQRGVVDAILTSSLRMHTGERVLLKISEQQFYAVTAKDNAELMAEIDYAMDQIELYNPYFEHKLMNKIYGSLVKDTKYVPAFSNEELLYIKENPELTIIVPPVLRPVFYQTANGEPMGILSDIAKLSFEPYGFNVNFEFYNNDDAYKIAKAEKSGDVIALQFSELYIAETSGIQFTQPYIDMTFNLLTRMDFEQTDEMSIAALKNSGFTDVFVKQHFNSDNIIYYNNYSDCLNAVAMGEVDGVVINTYAAEYVMQQNPDLELMSVAIPNYSSSLSMGTYRENGVIFHSIINKCISSLSSAEINDIVEINTRYAPKEFTFMGYVYSNPLRIITAFAILMCFIFALLIMIIRSRRQRQSMELVHEAARFGAIVAKTGSSIDEINLENNTKTHYSFMDNKLFKSVVPITLERNLDYAKRGYVHPDDVKPFTEAFSAAKLNELVYDGGERIYEFRAKTEDGTYSWKHIQLLALKTEAPPPYLLLAIIKDINDFKSLELETRNKVDKAMADAHRASVIKGEFTSRISHELRTPIEALHGYVEGAEQSLNNRAELKNYIDKSKIAIANLDELINDVLDWSFIHSNNLKIELKPFGIKSLVDSLCSSFHNELQENHITLHAYVADLDNLAILGDKYKLTHVIKNLLSNAIKFTEPGGEVALGVYEVDRTASNIVLRFEVSDTGIGIREEFIPYLFESYEQDSSILSKDKRGIGLGLPIAYNIVKAMGGTIHVSSVLDKGTDFVFELSFLLSAENSAKNNLLNLNEEPMQTSRILISKCNEQIANYISDAGVEVDTVNDAAAVAVKYQEMPQGTYSLIVLDVDLDEGDVIKAIKTIRRSDAECNASIPIILLGTNALSEDVSKELDAGANEYFLKPIDYAQIKSLLIKYYGREG